jgi:membrane-bound inhibitor of C-type lysozyme
MNALSVIAAAAAAGAIAAPARAETQMQPPMNDFYEAFYTCEGGAFLVSYDSETPASATLTTSDKNKKYQLKRASAPTGVKFAGDTAKFWTDGKTVQVEGTAAPLRNCKKTR